MAKKNVQTEELRESCLMCVAKHLGQARALSLEICKGYPEHYFFALGHMAEAEDECVKEFPRLAAFIRDQRLQWQQDAGVVPYWKFLMDFVFVKMDKAKTLPRNWQPENPRWCLGNSCGMNCNQCPAAKRGRQ